MLFKKGDSDVRWPSRHKSTGLHSTKVRSLARSGQGQDQGQVNSDMEMRDYGCGHLIINAEDLRCTWITPWLRL